MPGYDDVMRAAVESVLLVAARSPIDTTLIAVTFDAGRGPGPHESHTLTISVRETSIAVSDHAIPHDWLPSSTGFIDSRFAKLIGARLADLTAKAQAAGVYL